MVNEKVDLTTAINVLENRKSDLISQYDSEINKLQQEIIELENDKATHISAIEISLKELRLSNTVCEKCRGKGEVREVDAAGDVDWETCKKCMGTGKSK